jgi:amino acid adenylation domain-containing protein
VSEPAGFEGRIAIIGMAGRFPGADTIAEFWDNLCQGVNSVTFFTEDQLDDWFDRDVRSARNYVKARPILAEVDKFDAAFFAMHAKEAELTDPQHRVFLECAWEALEDAGYDPAAYDGAIGVFAGCSMNTYFLNNICRDRRAIEEFTSNFQVGTYSTLLGAGREFLATRVSYKLDLKGPSLTVQTACSTSLVAVAQACQSLLLYQADMALAGGVSITFPQNRGYVHQEGGMVSADGRCRPFDAAASGTIFGSGAGVVLLKRLDDALADGDHIYAVILGCGVNNDGASKVGFTAPSVAGQAAAIEMALAQAATDARSIGYVECHGTATPLGDPIEIAGLTKAFRNTTADRQFCSIGSVKGNIGHLDAAAGAAGLIKAALMLKHRRLVPSLHFERPNPQIAFGDSPFFVNTGLREWPESPAPRRAGVSSLGVGGTNAHVVLEEAPAVFGGVEVGDQLGRAELLLLSARSQSALAEMRSRLAANLRAPARQSLADIAYTLQQGRRHFAHRCALACRDRENAAALIADRDSPRCRSSEAMPEAPPVIFMFPGQGAQYPGMGSGLYRRFPVFRQEIERCAAILASHGLDLVRALYSSADAAAGERLALTGTAQPAIFAVEYALAQLWRSWGIEAKGFIGHSVGEFVAACLAGVFSLADALGLVAARGRLMEGLPRGAMTAVRLAEHEIAPYLGPSVSLAAVNGPSHCVLAGAVDAVEEVETRLEAHEAAFRRLHTSHAFHSAMMDPMIGPFAELVDEVRLAEPRVSYVSGVTGDWVRPEEATSPGYWARHAREPVRFAAGVKTLTASASPILLEIGPGNTLATLASQTARNCLGRIIGSLPDATGRPADDESMLDALGMLWVRGVNPDWRAIAEERRSRVSLPTYPFERRRHWIDPPGRAETDSGRARIVAPSTPPPDAADAATNEPAMNASPISDIGGDRSMDVQPDGIRDAIIGILEEISGESVGAAAPTATFLEMGFDSLSLSQVAQRLQGRFKVKIAFRQLLGELSTIPALAAFIRQQTPASPINPASATAALPVAAAEPPAPAAAAGAPASSPVVAAAAFDGAPDTGVAGIMRAQVEAMSQLIQQQLETLRRIRSSATAPSVDVAPLGTPAVPADAPSEIAAASLPAPEPEQRPSRFQAYRPVRTLGEGGPTPSQKRHIDELVARYTAKTATSKRLTATYRSVLADPRAVAGFRGEWKELVYPIVCTRANGSRIWDVDGNEYIDLVNGYGPTAFGHAADFVVEAIREQLDKGFAIGPQAEFAGEIATLFTEMTGNERMTFCNTGSEAVMAALRVARAVTGRTKVVLFSGAYHGQFDEVLVRGSKRSDGTVRSVPVAAGIPASAVENVTVLDYATTEALQWVKDHAEDLAAVVVEPVQSRHPDLQPFDFLRQLRQVTEAAGAAFVMDEIVTGFRVHPGGMQAVTGIRADLATYGKVIGGGMPIGILAGKAKFMDALDGGAWNYGDDSAPEVGVTFFAGTFVRHPLALAAVRAVLQHLKAHGPDLQEQVARRAAGLADLLNHLFSEYQLSTKVEHCSSFLYFSLHAEHPFAGLLFHHLRDRGIHIQDGFPLFLTTAHTDKDVAKIAAAFRGSIDEMARAGILGTAPAIFRTESAPAETPLDAARGLGGDAAARHLALTESQIEIWLSAQMGDEASCAFNESITLRLTGQLDEDAIAGALHRVVARHDALRTRFSATGEEMSIAEDVSFQYPTTDATVIADRSPAEVLSAYIDEDARTPFDLVNGPPIRAHLFKLSPTSHALVLTAHHIICDGWSMNVIIAELAEVYAALREGRQPDLPASLPFSDYARAQQRQKSAERTQEETYWLGQFEKPVQPIDLPTDRLRSSLKTSSGSTRCRRIDATLYRAVRAAGARQGCTLFVTLLAGFEALMGRLAGVEEVVVGVPTAGQSLVEDKVLVGHCVNFLPIRGAWSEETSIADHLGAVKKQVLDAYEHQDYTLGTLVRKLSLAREANRLPLTEIQFNLERLADQMHSAGLEIEAEPNPKAHVNFDIFWNIIESNDGLRIDCDYNTDLFDAATIDRWLECYEALLEAISADPAQLVVRASYIPPAELRRITTDFNDTAADYPQDRCTLELIEARAAEQPEAAAVIFDRSILGHRELDEQANRLANHLLSKIEGPGARIGVLVDRSAEMLVALLAVWKAGCAYVPLDPSHPVGRLRHILGDADVSALVTDGGQGEFAVASGVAIINLQAERRAIDAAPATRPAPFATAEATAYLIYTSGSTGRPKGVEVSHRALVNLLCSMARQPGINETDIFLALTTIAFDIAALELFLPLSVGATLAIAARPELSDGHRLLARMEATGASIVQATPASWRLLLEAGFRSRPGFKMLCGGEALSRELADRLLEGGGALWNMYGPTETTVWSSCAAVRAGNAPITIGRPIANTQFHVLDSYGQTLPIGVPGELHIGGDGVAKGYFRQDDLTAEKFVADPFGLTPRLYRSGDIARRLPNGEIQLLGRSDLQIKLRGFRIELGEIEAALSRQAGLAAAAVVLREDTEGKPLLVGYVVEQPGQPRSDAELRALLADELPDYMVPAIWVRLDTLPISPNGKLDRAALPAPGSAPLAADAYSPPETPLETALASIWAEVLKVERVGRHDELFALGADSIHLFQIAARANRQGMHLSARQLLEHRTVAELAPVLERVAATSGGDEKQPAASLRQFHRSRSIPGSRHSGISDRSEINTV